LATELKFVQGKTIDNDPRTKTVPPNKAAIQIHQWHDDTRAGEYEKKIADWVIAERLLVERGDTIGRRQVEVEIPTWDEMRGHFHLGLIYTVLAKVGGKPVYKEVRKGPVPVDFGQVDKGGQVVVEKGPVVVDFVAGRRNYSELKGATEDASLEMLLMMPDGKLIVRNSRDDSDEETPSGAERLRRYDAWRARLTSYRQAGLGVEQPKGP
jgi:hypothetical protein